MGGGCELKFPPGSAFSYSDQGTDTLTAVIEIVTEMPVADFVRTRLLEPIGMAQTTCVMTSDNALRPLALAKYAGSPKECASNW